MESTTMGIKIGSRKGVVETRMIATNARTRKRTNPTPVIAKEPNSWFLDVFGGCPSGTAQPEYIRSFNTKARRHKEQTKVGVSE
jgi:hypothetical protein